MFIVIGSGPSGVACSLALLSMNKRVLMIDVGVTLEDDKQEMIRRMSSSDKRDWKPEWIDSLKGSQQVSVKGFNQKKTYASDFPYQVHSTLKDILFKNAIGYVSNAQGGLSNVWGGAILPYSPLDTSEWPFPISRLDAHYDSLLSHINYSHADDHLSEMFSFKLPKSKQTLRMSRQAESCLECLNKYKNELVHQGIKFSQATLAVKAGDESVRGCVYCALCLYGCPYRHIYNSAFTVDALKKNENFSYLNGIFVESIQETNQEVVISAFTENGEKKQFVAERAYLACGPLSTAKIILESQQRWNEPLTMKDSQYFLLPIIFARGTKNIFNEELYTLSQFFLELHDSNISRRNIHLQTYTYNDFIRHLFDKRIPGSKFLKPFIEKIVSRMGVIQGYLHSDDSSQIELSLHKHDKNNLNVKGIISPQAAKTVQKIIRKLKQNKKMLGFNPIKSLLSMGLPGQGWHTGSTFPMKENTSKYNESDVYGRPHGYQKLHIVDSSILPSIPATTITFSVMANAHRIGMESTNL